MFAGTASAQYIGDLYDTPSMQDFDT